MSSPEKNIIGLPAYEDTELSEEGAEQLVRMSNDPTVPTHTGAPLPLADREALLAKAKAKLPLPVALRNEEITEQDIQLLRQRAEEMLAHPKAAEAPRRIPLREKTS